MDGSKLVRHKIRKTQNSFYECISVAIYGDTQRSKYIRTALWDSFSMSCFGCNVSALTDHVTSASFPSCVPQGPLHAWEFPGAYAWMQIAMPECKDKRQETFSMVNVQEALARFIISSSIQRIVPDTRIVGQTVCNCFNVGLVAFSSNGRSVTFEPSGNEGSMTKDWMIYIHMIRDADDYWDLLMERTNTVPCVPKHVIHTLTEESLADDLKGLVLDRHRATCYQIKVFDGKKRRTFHVGDMEAPVAPNRVHHLSVDATNAKDWWVFVLYKERRSPTEQLSDKDIWIFAKRRNVVHWISIWKRDLTAPTFFLNVDETAVYVVEADDKETAAACVRKEFQVDVLWTTE